MTSKRNAGDVLADLEASEIADEAEQALAMTPEQRGAAIAAAGISRDELEARAADWHEQMTRAAAAAQGPIVAAASDASFGPRSSRTAVVVLLVAAVAVAAVVLALLLFPRAATREAPVAVPSEFPVVGSNVGAQPAAPSSVPAVPSQAPPGPTEPKPGR